MTRSDELNAEINFYPRPPRGGRLSEQTLSRSEPKISIHALREEGDLTGCTTKASILQFLSTPSARRATSGSFPRWGCPRYFYPRPPRGGRRAASRRRSRIRNFYPRPPRGGRR